MSSDVYDSSVISTKYGTCMTDVTTVINPFTAMILTENNH